MPEEARTPSASRMSSTVRSLAARIALAAVVAVIASIPAAGAPGPRGAVAGDASGAPPEPPVRLAVGAPFDAGAYAEFIHFARVASEPTPTPPPPPPTPTPLPLEPTATPVVVRPVAPPAPPPAPASPPGPPPAAGALDTSPMDAYEQALFDATNRRRVANGLPPLQAAPALVGVARVRSLDMAVNGYFSHTSPVTGDTAFSLMDRHGVAYGWAGENLAKNNYPDNETVAVADEALWNSPSHRENILNPYYTHAGIALAVDGAGMKYFTVVFIGPP